MNTRIRYIDLAKGLTMLLVLVGHIDTIEPVKHLIYSFHMPLFFLLSGYFMKLEGDIQVEIKKSFRSLIVPYIVVALFIRIYQVILNAYINAPVVDLQDILSVPLVMWRIGDTVVSAGAIWFLVALFGGKIYLLWALKQRYPYAIVAFGAFVSLMITSVTHIVVPCCIQHMLTCAPFLLIGSYLRKYKIFDKKIDTITLLALAIPILCYATSIKMGMRMNSMSYFAYATATIISIVFIYILKELDETNLGVFRKINDIFIWCGRYSLVILCVHSVEARFEWFSLPHYLFPVEILVRFTYIVVLSYILIKIPFVRKIFNLK